MVVYSLAPAFNFLALDKLQFLFLGYKIFIIGGDLSKIKIKISQMLPKYH